MTSHNKHKVAAPVGEAARYRNGYFSLNKVFTISFAIVLILSGIVASIAYDRLVAFEALLDETTTDSLPKVMNYAKMYSQVNELTYSTDSLLGASSQGQRKIAYEAIKEKIKAIPPLAIELGNNKRLFAQIEVIEQEIDALNELIEQGLNITDMLSKQRKTMYRIYDVAVHDNALANADFAYAISTMIIEAEEALTFKRLNTIRQSSRNIDALYQNFNGTLSLNTPQKKLFSDLHSTLASKSGVLSHKTDHLRLLARIRGRADFVRNLVIDYARLAEFESFKYSKSVMAETEKFSGTVEQQIRTLGVTAIFTLFVIVIIVFFIQRHLVRRLVLLNKKVVSRLAGEHSDLRVGGKDEITDIAKSFEEFAQTIERQKKELVKTSLTDGLTNIANRRALDKAFKHLLRSAQRQQWPISILMMDVDNFKAYNDFYGHVAGDDCLQKIAEVVQKVMRRPEDFVARYGGEEFVCLLPNTPLDGAQVVADGILAQLKFDDIPHERSDVASHVTVSIGIAIYDAETEETADTLLKQADTALYRAKKRGKNCHSN